MLYIFVSKCCIEPLRSAHSAVYKELVIVFFKHWYCKTTSLSCRFVKKLKWPCKLKLSKPSGPVLLKNGAIIYAFSPHIGWFALWVQQYPLECERDHTFRSIKECDVFVSQEMNIFTYSSGSYFRRLCVWLLLSVPYFISNTRMLCYTYHSLKIL